MTDEAKLHSPIHSTFEALVVRLCSQALSWRKTAISVDQCWLQALQFSVHLIDFLTILFRCNGFTRIQKAVWIRGAADHQTVTMTIFWCKFGFGKCFGVSSPSSHWAGHCWSLYKIHFSLHITIQLRNGSLLLCRIRENDTLKWWFLWLAVRSWSTHLSSFFTFPVCFKCWATIEWSTLSSSATSYVAVISASMILSPGYYQLLMVTHCTPPFAKALISLAKCLEPLVSSSWANCIVDVVSYLHCLMSHF